MAYNTLNPLGSKDPRDLYDNATNFDKYANGLDPMYPNRFGEQKLSIEGMNQAFNSAQDGRAAQFDAVLASIGFSAIGDYGAGVTFTTRQQYTVRGALAYTVANSTTLPFTLTGTWATDEPKLKLINSDQILRSDLAQPHGAQEVGGAIVTVSSQTELRALATDKASKWAVIQGQGFISFYTLDVTDSVSADDNGGVIAPSVGPGRWKLNHNGTVSPKQWGAKGDATHDTPGSDDTVAIRACFDFVAKVFDGFTRPGQSYFDSNSTDGQCAHVHFPRGYYGVTGEIAVPRGILLTGDNARNHGGTRIKQFTPGLCTLDCYGYPTTGIPDQFIADQRIVGLFVSSVSGSGIRCRKPVGASGFYSPGSLTIDSCFFLNLSGPAGTQYAGIDADYIERVTNCTFDAMEGIGLHCAQVSVCTGNTFFFNARGGIILDLSRSAAQQVATTIVGNTFISNGGDGSGGTGPYQAALGILGTGTTSECRMVTFKGNTIAGLDNAGAHGVVAENVVLVGCDIELSVTGIKGDGVRVDAARDCTFSGFVKDSGTSSLGVYAIGVLGAAVNCNFIDIQLTGNGGVANVHLGTGSSGNKFDGLRQDVNRFEAPVGYGRRINDWAAGGPENVLSMGPATSWAAVSFQSPWVNFDTANAVQYRRDELGKVHLRGRCKAGPLGSSMFTLPVGFRVRSGAVAKFITKIGPEAGAYGELQVNSVGDVYAISSSTSNTGDVSLDSVSFYPEA